MAVRIALTIQLPHTIQIVLTHYVQLFPRDVRMKRRATMIQKLFWMTDLVCNWTNAVNAAEMVLPKALVIAMETDQQKDMTAMAFA